MNVNGLDRVEFMVRDLEKAIDFFSTTYGMQFKQVSPDIAKRDGVRSAICHNTHVHLIAPIYPIPDNAPPPFKKKVAMLEEREMFVIAVSFRVDDPNQAADELEAKGIRIQHRYDETSDYVSLGMDNFAQVIPDDKDTLGVLMPLAKYDRV